MIVESDTVSDTETQLTVQIIGANILRSALELLLASTADVSVVTDDGRVTLLVGSEGQTQLRQSPMMGKRRRREHFALLTNANDIDYHLVREGPIEVFVGSDEALPTLIQGLLAASRREAFCSQQLVPALIAAAVNSASNGDRKPSALSPGDVRRHAADRTPRRPLSQQRVPLEDDDGDYQGDPTDVIDEALSPADPDPSLINQEQRTLHLAIALGLSEREAEVAIEAVKGFSNTEIAELLNMSVPTIKYHLYQAYQKLGIHRRSQLAAALFLPESEG